MQRRTQRTGRSRLQLSAKTSTHLLKGMIVTGQCLQYSQNTEYSSSVLDAVHAVWQLNSRTEAIKEIVAAPV
jgi:hypothetical protein